MQNDTDKAQYVNLTASAAVKSGKGTLVGIFVATTTSGTIKVWDSTAASGAVLLNTFTPSAGTLYTFPKVRFKNGLYVTIANTIDITVFYA